MASQKKEPQRYGERVVPNLNAGSSRVSKAAGSLGSQSSEMTQRSRTSSPKQSTRAEQRSSTSKQSSRATPKQTSRGKQSQNPDSRRNASPNRSTPTYSASPTTDPKDIQFIRWAHDQWNGLNPHQQQSVFGSLLLCLALILFSSLTFFHTAPILKNLSQFFFTFFGWSAYPLAIGLIAFAVAHLLEGIRQDHFIRKSMVIGLIVIWLLLLLESRLIFGRMSVGALAEVLVIPLLGWPPAVGHVILLGLLMIATTITFRITFAHVLLVAAFLQRLLADNPRPAAEQTSSPFLGQRPQYSRYGKAIAQDAATATPTRQGQKPVRAGRRAIEDDFPEEELQEEEEENEDIIFEDEAVEEDPLNDINIHKQHIAPTARGTRTPKPINLAEHAAAIQGVNQQPLFEQATVKDMTNPQKVIIKVPSDMEPLVPNPRRTPKNQAADAVPNIKSIWKLPDTSLLHNPEDVKQYLLGDDTANLARTIQETLRSFRVDAEVRQEDISIGPTVIRFGIRPTGKPEMKQDEKSGKMVPVRDASGNIVYEVRTRVSRIMALQNDLALVLEAKTIRMEAPVPGRPYVGVEIPNKNSRLVTLREILESKEYQTAKTKSKLTIGLGKDVAGQVRVGDLARMPHVLIAGATGAGKSVCINTIIASILTQATPDDVRMLMVDPKMVELNMYNGVPHLLSPVVTEVEKVVPLLKNAISEMERRYRLFSQLNVRNLDGYRKLRLEKFGKGDDSLNNLPAIVIIIDELADLMMAAPEEVEGMICRLAQLARATGIHLVVATQRPSVDVITGLIKANIPTRISFMVSSAVDSRTIIDMGGAERLLGRGDMLYLPADAGRPERIQGAFLADDEAENLVNYWRDQTAQQFATDNHTDPTALLPPVEPGWEVQEQISDEFELDDDLLDKAEEVVREYARASISLLQRRLRIGYSRAARLIDLLEERGIIGHSESGGRSREVLDGNGGKHDRYGSEEGPTMADEVADILAEEKARDDFLKKQATSLRQPSQRRKSKSEGTIPDSDEYK